MASPFPFVAGAVLTAAQLNSIGEAGIAFTPTWTNLTVGNAVQDFKYTRVNKLVFVRGSIVLGSTSSVTGTVLIGFPFTAAAVAGRMYFGETYFLDSGVAAWAGVLVSSTTTASELGVYNVAGTYASVAGINATTPMTWTTNDAIRLSFVYEAA